MRIPICGIGITTHAQQPNIARKKLGNGSCDVFMPRQACHDDGEVRDYQSQQQAKKDAEDKLHDVSLIHLELRCGEKSAKQHRRLERRRIGMIPEFVNSVKFPRFIVGRPLAASA
jgi:hypothetical protein